MEKNNNTKYIIIFASVVVIFLVLIIGFYLFTKNVWVTNNTTKTAVTTTVSTNKITCGKLVADNGVVSGTAPFSPVLRGHIGGAYTKNAQICNWSIDNASDYSSFPVNGECVFGGNNLMTKGVHAIEYSIKDACSASINVTVN
jgi:hypothetical protein